MKQFDLYLSIKLFDWCRPSVSRHGKTFLVCAGPVRFGVTLP